VTASERRLAAVAAALAPDRAARLCARLAGPRAAPAVAAARALAALPRAERLRALAAALADTPDQCASALRGTPVTHPLLARLVREGVLGAGAPWPRSR